MTPEDLKKLNTFKVARADIFRPYDFVCDNQNDLCELNRSDTDKLLALISAIPRIVKHKGDDTQQYVSRTVDDKYLFVEVRKVTDDRYLCTSFVDDLDYLHEYMPLDAPTHVPSNTTGLSGCGVHSFYVD